MTMTTEQTQRTLEGFTSLHLRVCMSKGAGDTTHTKESPPQEK